MADYGAWQGLGNAISTGADAFSKARAARDAATRQATMDAEAKARQAEMDARYDQERATKDKQWAEEMAYKNKSLAQTQQEKAAKKAAGRPISVNTAEELGDRLAIPSELQQNAADVKGNPNLLGWENNILTKIPFLFHERKDVASKVGTLRKLAARAIEGARLTDSDMDYYTKNLPSETDTPKEFENKTRNLTGLIARTTGARLDSIGKAGFDISGYDSDAAKLKELGKQTGETGGQSDPRMEMAKQALDDPEATPQEKAQAKMLLGL
jgi:hypothetical protein